MRLVFAWNVKAGRRYRVVQRYTSGTIVTYEGEAYLDGDDNEYVYMRNMTPINCHSYVGMDAEVWEI